MSYKEHSHMIGLTSYYEVKPKLWIAVKVEDLKESYGRTLAKIRPVEGIGELWVEVSKIGSKQIKLEMEHLTEFVHGTN